MTAFIGNDSASQEREVRRIVEGLRSPEVDAKLPEVEAMKLEDRVKLVDTLHGNIAAVIADWKKFGPLLIARGMTKKEVKADLNRKKRAGKHLLQAKRLVSSRYVFGAFKERGEAYFNVFVAWLLAHEALLVDVLGTGSIKKSTELQGRMMDVAFENRGEVELDDDGLPDDLVKDVAMDGPQDARTVDADDMQDLARDATA